MTRRQVRKLCKGALFMTALALLALPGPARAQGEAQDASSSSGHPRIKSFAVEMTDETLTYPSYLVDIPDEHTTFLPVSAWLPDTYLVFASSKVQGGTGGAVVLETTDLKHFHPATAAGYNEQVMAPPVAFTACDPIYDTEFDENYSAPGSVVQDPTLPPGNLIMLYEAENHCPSGMHQQPFYATVGFARSPDNGRTWPPPANAEFGNAARHPIFKDIDPEPPFQTNSENMGDALPSAFVDKTDTGDAYLYVTYGYAAGPNRPKPTDGSIRVGRAQLNQSGQLQFFKWYNDAFSQPGIAGLDSGVLPTTGCAGRQVMSEISYNDDLGLYLIIFVCNPSSKGFAAWYYSTATSLALEDWTEPQMIANSEHAITAPCNFSDPNHPTGSLFDGFYPSFMSPGSPAGHTRLTGRAFFLNGCDTGLPRAFASRTFTITTEP
jgi:hypothetical protein